MNQITDRYDDEINKFTIGSKEPSSKVKSGKKGSANKSVGRTTKKDYLTHNKSG